MTEVELHIHIKREGKSLITPERMLLLKEINRCRSITTASRRLGISYNKAWRILDAFNASADKPIIRSLRGGNCGGGVYLTRFGRVILTEYQAVENEVNKFMQHLNSEINL